MAWLLVPDRQGFSHKPTCWVYREDIQWVVVPWAKIPGHSLPTARGEWPECKKTAPGATPVSYEQWVQTKLGNNWPKDTNIERKKHYLLWWVFNSATTLRWSQFSKNHMEAMDPSFLVSVAAGSGTTIWALFKMPQLIWKLLLTCSLFMTTVYLLAAWYRVMLQSSDHLSLVSWT